MEDQMQIYLQTKDIFIYLLLQRKIIQVTRTSGEYTGVGIVIIQIGDDPVSIPLYPSYLMRDNQ